MNTQREMCCMLFAVYTHAAMFNSLPCHSYSLPEREQCAHEHGDLNSSCMFVSTLEWALLNMDYLQQRHLLSLIEGSSLGGIWLFPAMQILTTGNGDLCFVFIQASEQLHVNVKQSIEKWRNQQQSNSFGHMLPCDMNCVNGKTVVL